MTEVRQMVVTTGTSQIMEIRKGMIREVQTQLREELALMKHVENTLLESTVEGN